MFRIAGVSESRYVLIRKLLGMLYKHSTSSFVTPFLSTRFYEPIHYLSNVQLIWCLPSVPMYCLFRCLCTLTRTLPNSALPRPSPSVQDTGALSSQLEPPVVVYLMTSSGPGLQSIVYVYRSLWQPTRAQGQAMPVSRSKRRQRRRWGYGAVYLTRE